MLFDLGRVSERFAARALGAEGGNAGMILIRAEGALVADPFTGAFSDSIFLLPGGGASALAREGGVGFAIQMVNRGALDERGAPLLLRNHGRKRGACCHL